MVVIEKSVWKSKYLFRDLNELDQMPPAMTLCTVGILR